jgi:hypothetical protein
MPGSACHANIPSQYDFLMQAMLGLAASHLMMTSTSQLTFPALSHRVQAMKGLNVALSKPPECAEESDAILATCWALAFQTSYIGDSVEEFLAMLRGCTIIVGQDWREKLGTSFQRCGEGQQAEIINPRLETLPLINQSLVAEARESFEKLGVLEMTETERDVFEYMFDMTKLLSVSSLHGESSRLHGLGSSQNNCHSISQIQRAVLLPWRINFSSEFPGLRGSLQCCRTNPPRSLRRHAGPFRAHKIARMGR